MSSPPSSPPVAADPYVTTVTADDDGDEVGFESTTVLYSPANMTHNITSGGDNLHPGCSDGGGSAASLPYAMYESVYTQQHPQQQGILGSVFPTSNVSNLSTINTAVFSHANDAVGILGAPTASSVVPTTPLSSIPTAPQHQQQQAAPQTQLYSYVEEGLDVPLHAPRLRVPSDLPLEQTTLMDLLAMVVVQGGPTTEEEIVKREITRRNPAFVFLGEKFNNPCLLYYRWRLYSLLQQDTLLTWRTTPFQIERARRAYVFVPPPVLRAGPECLAGLHQPELLKATDAPHGGVKRTRGGVNGGEDTVGEEEEEIIVTRKARRRKHHRHHTVSAAAAAASTSSETKNEEDPEKANRRVDDGYNGQTPAKKKESGSSSSSSSDSESSSSNSDDDGARNRRNLSLPTTEVQQGIDSDKDAPHEGTNKLMSKTATEGAQSTLNEVEPPVSLPPPSAQWISRQCIINKHIFTVLQPQVQEEWSRLLNPRLICAPSACKDMKELCEAWLRRSEIAVRMSFAVQHADGIHHLLSILLDAVVKAAYVVTARSRAPLPTTDATTANTTTTHSASTSIEADSCVFCVEALWYLYVLHDILMNASNMPAGSSAAAAPACCVNKNVRPMPTSQSFPGGEEDESIFKAADSSPETLETLYIAFKQQQQQQQSARSPASSPVSFANGNKSNVSGDSALTPPQFSTQPSSTSATSTAANAVAHLQANVVARHRRRQRTTRRRSPYERCGDALEIILPTLLEAVTAIALAVSLDKERQLQLPPPPNPNPDTPTTANNSNGNTSRASRVHHFKVVNPLQAQRPQGKKKVSGGESAVEVNAPPALTGGSCLTLRFDAGCSPVDDAVTEIAKDNQQHKDNRNSESNINNGETQKRPSAACATSSAPAVLLLEWLKVLVRVWMNVEQPLLLPLPSAGLPSKPPSKENVRKEGGSRLFGVSTSASAESGEEVVAVPPPPGLLWPETTAGAPDAPEVQLGYFVNAQHAHLLGLEATTMSTYALQSAWGERREPPLLSARACAIIKDRYSFLF